MAENKRFREMMDYLKKNRYIRNQQDFTERVNSDKATVSQIMNDKISIPNIMFGNIGIAFPFISIEWLKDGKGDMLRANISQTSQGDYSPNINGSRNTVGDSRLLEKALDEISAMRVALTDALKVNQDNTSRLLCIIENMNK